VDHNGNAMFGVYLNDGYGTPFGYAYNYNERKIDLGPSHSDALMIAVTPFGQVAWADRTGAVESPDNDERIWALDFGVPSAPHSPVGVDIYYASAAVPGNMSFGINYTPLNVSTNSTGFNYQGFVAKVYRPPLEVCATDDVCRHSLNSNNLCVDSGNGTWSCSCGAPWVRSPDGLTCYLLCPPLNNSATYSVVTTKAMYPNRAFYTCASGRYTEDLLIRDCQPDQSWGGSAPVCIRLPTKPPCNDTISCTATPDWVVTAPIYGNISDIAAAAQVDLQYDYSRSVIVMSTYVSAIDIYGNNTNATAVNGTDTVIVKYSPTGVPAWTVAIKGTGLETDSSLAVDPNNDIYFSLTTDSTNITVGGVRLTPQGGSCLIGKLNGTNGNVIWTTVWGSTGGVGCASIGYASGQVSVSGQLCKLCGTAQNSTIAPGLPAVYMGGAWAWVGSINSSNGASLWIKTWNAYSAEDHGVDKMGNIYVTGRLLQLYGTMIFETISFPINTYGEAYLIKLNSGGTPVWGRQTICWNRTSQTQGFSVGVDPDTGHVYWGGTLYYSTPMQIGTLPVKYYNYGAFLAKVDTQGIGRWGVQFPLSNLDAEMDIVVDRNGYPLIGFTGGFTYANVSSTWPSLGMNVTEGS